MSTDLLGPGPGVPDLSKPAVGVGAAGTRVERLDFRRAAGRFATGICVVATRHAGVEYAMTVNAFTSVSLEPPLVLVCVEKITRFHEAVLATGAWSVSVLDDGAEEVSRWFAAKGRPTNAQLDDYAHHPGDVTGMPVLDIAMAVIECRTVAVYDGGDHDIVLGEVVAVQAGAQGGGHGGALADAAPRRPLVYFEGRYRTVADLSE